MGQGSDFGFCGGAYVAPSLYQNDSESINWFCEVDPTKADGERGKTALYPTPGLTAPLVTPAVAEVRALFTIPGGQTLLAIVGSGFYTITSSYVATLAGTLASSSGPLYITTNGISAYWCDGANRYTYTFSGGAFTIVASTDGAFTGGGRADISDNFIVYSRPGTQQWAATSPLSIVTPALSFSSKDGAPDNLVACFVNNRNVFLLGERTMEAWIDVGSFPFPFQRIPGTSQQHGCVSANSISRLGNSFAFLSADDRGQGLVLVMNGYSPVEISTHAVTNDIANVVISDAQAYTYQIEGHEFYVLTFPTADKTWVYDSSTQLWHKWRWSDSFNQYHRHRSNCAAVFQGKVLVGDWQNGNIYQLSNTTYTDNGAIIKRLRRCPHLTSDLHQVYYSKLQLQFQPGVGLSTGQGSNPQAMLRWSNDGGSTWSNEHWVSIGMIGKYLNRAVWRRLGVARDRVFEVIVTDPVKAVIISAALEALAGEN